jgi:hypothetical protein
MPRVLSSGSFSGIDPMAVKEQYDLVYLRHFGRLRCRLAHGSYSIHGLSVTIDLIEPAPTPAL